MLIEPAKMELYTLQSGNLQSINSVDLNGWIMCMNLGSFPLQCLNRILKGTSALETPTGPSCMESSEDGSKITQMS